MSTPATDSFDISTQAIEVIDGLATAVIVLDERLSIRYLNTAAEQLLQVSHARANDKNVDELLPANEELLAEFKRVLSDGTAAVRREVPLRNFAGKALVVDCRVSLLEKETQPGLIVELLDAEPRQRINRETALLTQQSVSRQLTRQLAHEVKNPLGGLRGAAQLLQRQLESAELREYTEVIISETDRLASLVDSLLGPHQAIREQAINIHQLLDQVHKLLAAEAGARISIVQDYDPSLPELRLDADLITQAFLNIGRNAIQLLESGGTLRLRTRA
ncbi:MAG: PAS domain-containing protein, partial [Gammaproteobacteria bacterium]|nr:PAS domain-containing protein [Gammaproteobacteria bacterium]